MARKPRNWQVLRCSAMQYLIVSPQWAIKGAPKGAPVFRGAQPPTRYALAPSRIMGQQGKGARRANLTCVLRHPQAPAWAVWVLTARYGGKWGQGTTVRYNLHGPARRVLTWPNGYARPPVKQWAPCNRFAKGAASSGSMGASGMLALLAQTLGAAMALQVWGQVQATLAEPDFGGMVICDPFNL